MVSCVRVRMKIINLKCSIKMKDKNKNILNSIKISFNHKIFTRFIKQKIKYLKDLIYNILKYIKHIHHHCHVHFCHNCYDRLLLL